MTANHLQNVRKLYKTILKLHRGMPVELQSLGNEYVKTEFKRHKNCSETETKIFMHEWTNYAINLANQLGLKGKPKPINELGRSLTEEKLEYLRHEQIVQLYELMLAAKGDDIKQK